MADVWVIARFSPPTKLVDQKTYGVSRSMGYQGYGLRGLRLYLSYLSGAARCPSTGLPQALKPLVVPHMSIAQTCAC